MGFQKKFMVCLLIGVLAFSNVCFAKDKTKATDTQLNITETISTLVDYDEAVLNLEKAQSKKEQLQHKVDKYTALLIAQDAVITDCQDTVDQFDLQGISH